MPRVPRVPREGPAAWALGHIESEHHLCLLLRLSLGLWLQRGPRVGGAPADPALLWALRYATIYTMFPVFSLVLDQDVRPDMAMLYPELYKDLTKVRAAGGGASSSQTWARGESAR